MSLAFESEAAVVTADATSFDVLLTLTAPSEAGSVASSPPLNLSLAADVSGSMEGDKLECLRATLLFVVDNLSANDRLSISIFNSDA
jgi:hypothetical protein